MDCNGKKTKDRVSAHGLQFSYTQSFHRRHKKVGHLFQGRYKAIICDKDTYLLELIRYIHLNREIEMRMASDKAFAKKVSSLEKALIKDKRPLLVREVKTKSKYLNTMA